MTILLLIGGVVAVAVIGLVLLAFLPEDMFALTFFLVVFFAFIYILVRFVKWAWT